MITRAGGSGIHAPDGTPAGLTSTAPRVPARPPLTHPAPHSNGTRMTERLVLELPEPPSLNKMLDLAKERTRRTLTGGWMKRSLPVVYDQARTVYQMECTKALREAGVKPPRDAWAAWRLERAEFRLQLLRDPIELLAGLKWPIDTLVTLGYLAQDSPRELKGIPDPEQTIDRRRRGITLTIARA